MLIKEKPQSRYRRLPVLLVFCTILLFIYFNTPSLFSSNPSKRSTVSLKGLKKANSTLGFGALVAVSKAESARREGLLFAANITGLDITIPDQKEWNDDDIMDLVTPEGSTMNRGSAMAWLGHLNALRWFVDSGLETALIMEDDVDWDIHLRTVQVPKVAAAVRQLTNSNAGYWGHPDNWDILWLGHCGDINSAEKFNNPNVTKLSFVDDTLPSREKMHPDMRTFLDRLGIERDIRMVHKTVFPLCSFAYAVTQESARKMLDPRIAGKEKEGGCMAYDVRLCEVCRDLGFACWSSNPELFHHMEAPSEIANVNLGLHEQGKLGGFAGQHSPNIACGARSRNFYTKDPTALEYLQEVVGRQGHCLHDQLEEDMTMP
ncbi:MAG: hypothetical protein M1820_008293 [Bogoriella megaspora]|nr:MAG: hypothetical protein M1820_008293 [Bogoriella megaspora]